MPESKYETLSDTVLAYKKDHKIGRFDPAAPEIQERKVREMWTEVEDRSKYSAIPHDDAVHYIPLVFVKFLSLCPALFRCQSWNSAPSISALLSFSSSIHAALDILILTLTQKSHPPDAVASPTQAPNAASFPSSAPFPPCPVLPARPGLASRSTSPSAGTTAASPPASGISSVRGIGASLSGLRGWRWEIFPSWGSRIREVIWRRSDEGGRERFVCYPVA